MVVRMKSAKVVVGDDGYDNDGYDNDGCGDPKLPQSDKPELGELRPIGEVLQPLMIELKHALETGEPISQEIRERFFG